MNDAQGSDGPVSLSEMVTDRIQVGGAPRMAIVMLHGYAMQGSDLAPFAH